jgi:hypothetical protein
MKKIMTILLALTLLLAVTGCASNPTPSATPVVESARPSDLEQERPQDSGQGTATPAPSYDQLLRNYRLALSEKWDGETLIENDMSLLLLEKSEAEVGYCLLDINADGTDELLVGARTGEAYPEQMIFDLYTMQNGVPVHVFSGQERDRYYLYQDEAAPDSYFFYNENSSGASHSGYLSLHQEGEKLVVDQAVLYDAEADSQKPWFSGAELDGVLSNDHPMEESLARSIIESIQAMVVAPPFAAFPEK